MHWRLTPIWQQTVETLTFSQESNNRSADLANHNRYCNKTLLEEWEKLEDQQAQHQVAWRFQQNTCESERRRSAGLGWVRQRSAQRCKQAWLPLPARQTEGARNYHCHNKYTSPSCNFYCPLIFLILLPSAFFIVSVSIAKFTSEFFGIIIYIIFYVVCDCDLPYS